MNQIHQHDIHKITSGQVIIDLVSIVKELIENSIDANSKNIEVTFKDYGLNGLEIKDNGEGINELDFTNICQNHYTSKLLKFEDLNHVQTLGFRGEALSSICSISNLKIITTTQDILPYSYELEFNELGELISKTKKINLLNESGCKIIINDIFRRLPVRFKNFKKNINSEFNKMLSFIYNYILIEPNIKYLISNVKTSSQGDKKKNLIVTKGNNKMLDNFITLYGYKSTMGLNEINLSNNEVKISGYISDISIGYRNLKDRQFLFLNNRPIVNKNLMKLINETYLNYNTNYPVFILNFTIDNEKLDINLTPNKLFININLDHEKIISLLTDYFNNLNNLQTLKTEPIRTKPFFSEINKITKPKITERKVIKTVKLKPEPEIFNFVQSLNADLKEIQLVNLRAIQSEEEQKKARQQDDTEINEIKDVEGIETELNSIIINKLNFQEMKIIGQFNLGFIITKFKNYLFIIDQHASDEKYNYEDLIKNFKIKSQTLIKPIDLDLNVLEKFKINNSNIEFNGFKLNEDKSKILNLPIYKNIIFDISDFFELLHSGKISKILKICASKACRKSIMIGQPLNKSTMLKVVNNLTNLDKPWNCPHGRPTLRFLKKLNNEDLTEFNQDYEIY